MKFDLNAPNPIAPFRGIPAGRILERVIEKRLPQSTHVYNLMWISDQVPSYGIKWYTLHGTNCPDSWIVVTCPRADRGMEYSISGPPDAEITPEIREAFRTSTLFDWRKKFLFVATERPVSILIHELSALEYGNTTLFIPSWGFTMPVEEARIFCEQPSCLPPEATVRHLKDEPGYKFIVDGWEWTRPGTESYVRSLIDNFPSAGVYIREEPVSGIVTKCDGTLGMLYTLPEHRRKGYARAVYKHIIKEALERNQVPCIHISQNNPRSREMHEKLGFKFTHFLDYLQFDGSSDH